jgi:hypothetical protein
MDWVHGETLFKWVRARCREDDRQALGMAAARWLDLVAELEAAEIAHGDLQHANVMVTPDGQLKLVDYDGMCVPSLAGRRNLEVGVEPYQHPHRDQETLLSPSLDRFSAMVIYVALRALAANPGLWRTFVDEPEYDKLLFRKEDFQSPQSSPLLRELGRSAVQDVADLAEQLVELTRMEIDQVPRLGQLANPSFRRIEKLLVAHEWDTAVHLLNRRGQFRDAPPHLKPLIEQAYREVCRNQAWAKIQKTPRQPAESHDRRLVRAWNEVLFADFPPAEQERNRVAAARGRLAILDQVHRLAEQAQAAASLEVEKALAEAAAPLGDDYPHDLAARVILARRHVAAVGQIASALVAGSDEAIAAAWNDAVAQRSEDLVPQEWRRAIDLAQQRAAWIAALRQIPPNLPPDELDRRLAETWQADLLAGCADAEPWRPMYEAMVYRRGVLEALAAAINLRDDLETVRLGCDPCLAGYPLPADWPAAVVAARGRVASADSLVAALRDGDRETFVQSFDARMIRKQLARFTGYEELICRWTRREIAPLERLGLQPALGRSSLWCMDKARMIYRVTWTWPQQRFGDDCLLAICPVEPGAEDDPRDLEVYQHISIDRSNWESGGGSRVIHAQPEWAGGYVVVWAWIDVAFRRIPSQPLVLGRLEGMRQGLGRLWRLFSPRIRKTADAAPPVACPPVAPPHGQQAARGTQAPDGTQGARGNRDARGARCEGDQG